jgi:hypothetical protein
MTAVVRDAMIRIQVSYIETPNLVLTAPQVRRLCDLLPEVCDAALRGLVQAGFLREPEAGMFRRGGLGLPSGSRNDLDGADGGRAVAC